MTEWIAASTSLPTHPKVLAAAKDAGVSVQEIIGALICMWSYVAKTHPETGSLVGIDADMMRNFASSHTRKRSKIYAAVVANGFIACNEDASPTHVHDWSEWQAPLCNLAKKRRKSKESSAKNRQEAKAKKAARDGHGDNKRDGHGDAKVTPPTIQDNRKTIEREKDLDLSPVLFSPSPDPDQATGRGQAPAQGLPPEPTQGPPPTPPPPQDQALTPKPPTLDARGEIVNRRVWSDLHARYAREAEKVLAHWFKSVRDAGTVTNLPLQQYAMVLRIHEHGEALCMRAIDAYARKINERTNVVKCQTFFHGIFPAFLGDPRVVKGSSTTTAIPCPPEGAVVELHGERWTVVPDALMDQAGAVLPWSSLPHKERKRVRVVDGPEE